MQGLADERPREKVHAFRTVMDETGANRGYIISRVGFQIGAIEVPTPQT